MADHVPACGRWKSGDSVSGSDKEFVMKSLDDRTKAFMTSEKGLSGTEFALALMLLCVLTLGAIGGFGL